MLPERTAVRVSPGTVPVLALFVTLASPEVLAVLLLAALCHELGHYWALRHYKAKVETVIITPFGATMHLAERPQLSYGQEIVAVAAGPTMNLLMSVVCGAVGNGWPVAYLLAGAHLVLGVFNLLPIRPLDGGTLLWLTAAWMSDPFAADRIAQIVGCVTILGLCLLGGWFWWWAGSPFLLLSTVGLIPWKQIRKKTCKREKKQVK